MRSTRLMDEFMILSAPRFETVTTATALPRLYLDNNAETTECIPSVRCHQGLFFFFIINVYIVIGIIEACGSAIGNSSSSHTEGRKARGILGHARESLMAECNAPQLIFTSGATESNHLAIAAGMNAVVGSSPGSYRIVTTPFEHPSVTRVAAEYDPLYVKLLPGGEVDIKHLETLCSEPDVGMVSIILAHNELGIVQSIQEIRAAIERARLNREKNAGAEGFFYLGSIFINIAKDGAAFRSTT